MICADFSETENGLLDPIPGAPAHVNECARCNNRQCVQIAHLYAYAERSK